MEEAIRILFETNDVAKAIRRAPSTSLWYAKTGRLRVAAMTPSGRRLFDPDDVEALRELLAGAEK
jgi:hypothetical protein